MAALLALCLAGPAAKGCFVAVFAWREIHVLRSLAQAFCWSSKPITPALAAALLSQKHLVVQQDTPVRVLHRRAPKVRCAESCCAMSQSAPDGARGCRPLH